MLTALCLGASVCSCSAPADTGTAPTEITAEEENMTNTYILNEENVKLIGRTHLEDDNNLWFALSGTGFEFEFTGKNLEFSLIGDGASRKSDNEENYARYAVYVDGERVIDKQLDSPEATVKVIEAEEEKTSVVTFIKLSECAMSTLGVKPIVTEGTIKPTAEKDLKIEFIGDSITCGYGVDDEVKENHFKTATEDVTKAYAYKTAKALDADYSMFSTSGYGIISGYTDGDKPIKAQTIPQYYESLGFSYNSFAEYMAPNNIDWDFSRYVPDLIVVNLGTNDASYCKSLKDRSEDYAAEYTVFLKKIRKNNPDAKILCTLGVMGDSLFPYVEKAVEDYTAETGDTNIDTLRFKPQDGSLGYAADWHPTEATHQQASEALVEKIKEIMGL